MYQIGGSPNERGRLSNGAMETAEGNKRTTAMYQMGIRVEDNRAKVKDNRLEDSGDNRPKVKDNRLEDSGDNRPKVKDNRLKDSGDNRAKVKDNRRKEWNNGRNKLACICPGTPGFGMYRMEACQTAAEQCRTKLRWSSAKSPR